MPSPFPGMDPYLEGQLWPDVHHRLATRISNDLTPALRPQYVARIETQVVIDRGARADLGIFYPDISVLSRPQPVLHEAAVDYRRQAQPAPAPPLAAVITPASFWLPLSTQEMRTATIEIRETGSGRLVTAIEILSPANKRAPGLENYRAKRDRLIVDGVHLLEIDLLRRGERAETDPLVVRCDYVISLARARATMMEVWQVGLAESLPVVPVPLLDPDPDIPLDLQAALAAIYDEAGYDLSIDYTQDPPPPPLRPEDHEWLRALLAAKQGVAP